MTRGAAGAPGTGRALAFAMLAAGAALVVVVLWLLADGARGADDAVASDPDGPGPSFGLDPAPRATVELTDDARATAVPLDTPTGRIVPVERIDPVRAYDRTVLLAPDGNYVASRVLDADGVPLAGARVGLYEFDPGHHGERWAHMVEETLTDADGRFELGRGESDWFGSTWTRAWRLSVRADGHPRWHGFPVAAGAPADIRLPRGAPVTLELRLDDGSPLADAAVREHIVHVEDFHGDDAIPYWEWGRSDAAGRLELQLAAEHLDPLVRITHPDHESVLRLPAPDADGRVVLELQRHRAVEVVWVGDHAAHGERGLRLPRVSLVHVDEPRLDLFGGYATPGPYTFTTRTVEHGVAFEHLSDEPIELRAGRGGPVLVEAFVPQPGRARLELPLPPLQPFVPGESVWGFTLRLRSTGPGVGSLTGLVARSADGLEQTVANWPLSVDQPLTAQTTLKPPVLVSFAAWGDGGPHVAGVGPGDDVELVVDGARHLDWSAAVRVDTRRLDAARAANVRLKVVQAGRSAWARHERLLAAGLAPGTWTYRLWGDGVQRLEGEVELAVGDELVLEPLPAPWPTVDPRPHDLRAPHAIVEGSVRVLGDPWVHAERLRLRCTSPEPPTPAEMDALEFTRDGLLQLPVRGGGFRGAVPPGSWQVEVWLARNRHPARAIADGFGVEDDRRVERFEAQLDPPVELHVVEGERRALDLTVRTAPARGLILARLLLDGEPAPTISGDWGWNQTYEATWTSAAGETISNGAVALREGCLAVSVPPGPGTLRIVPRGGEHSAFAEGTPEAVEVELLAPPPYGAEGDSQALEVEVELGAPGQAHEPAAGPEPPAGAATLEGS